MSPRLHSLLTNTAQSSAANDSSVLLSTSISTCDKSHGSGEWPASLVHDKLLIVSNAPYERGSIRFLPMRLVFGKCTSQTTCNNADWKWIMGHDLQATLHGQDVVVNPRNNSYVLPPLRLHIHISSHFQAEDPFQKTDVASGMGSTNHYFSFLTTARDV